MSPNESQGGGKCESVMTLVLRCSSVQRATLPKDLLQLLKGSHVVKALAPHEEEWKSIEVSLGKLFCVQHWTVGPRPLTYQLAIQDCITNMDLDLWKIHSSNTFAWRAKGRPPNMSFKNLVNALLVKAHWRCPIQIWQLWLPFYPRPNISDIFFNLAPHFISIQIFPIDFEVSEWAFFNFCLEFSCMWHNSGRKKGPAELF